MGVYLTDFGLAKSAATGSRYTRTGEALGTPAYMSPEQARGEVGALTPATDVWALGCLGYELLAGRMAFEGDSPAQVIGAVLAREPAPLRRARRDVPAPLDALLRAALAKRPGDRPGSAGAIRDDLDRIRRGEAPHARPPRAARAPVAAVVVVVAAVGLVAAAALVPRSPPPSPAGPSRAEALAARARGLRQAEPREAARLLGEALALAPERDDWRLERGLLVWATGDGAGARAEWARIPAGSAAAPLARLYHALEPFFRVEQGRWRRDVARPALEALAEGDGPEAQLARAACAVMRSEWPAARAALRDVAGWSAALMRAFVEGTDPAGDRAAAIREYDRARAEGITFGWALALRGNAQGDLGDWRGALADFDAALRLMPGDPIVHLQRGVSRYRVGDYAGARDDFTAVLQVEPTHADALGERGAARLKLGDLDGALADLAAAVQHGRDDADVRRDLGLVRLRLGDPGAALVEFDRALRLKPGNPYLWDGRGQAKRALGDLAGALADHDRAVQLGPDEAELLSNRGAARYAARDDAGALADYDASLRLRPGNAEALNNRGTVRLARGDMAGALEDLTAVRRAHPELPDVHANLGLVHARSGAYAEAVASFREALRLAPDHPKAAEIRRLLANAEARLPGR